MYGVLAFGDSITNGGGELQWGVALQSWALWVARGLGLPYTGYAVDGATAARRGGRADPARRADAARWARMLATTSAACTSASTTSGALDWDPAASPRDHRAGAGVPGRALRARRWRVTAPRGSGARRRAPSRGRRAQRSDRAPARPRAERLVLDLRDFGARNQVMADRVHPTAFGQIAIAERALRVLAARRAADPGCARRA